MKKSEVLRVARRLIRKDGLINLTLCSLCHELDIPQGSFHYITGMKFTAFLMELRESTKPNLKRPITRHRVHKQLRIDHILAHATTLAQRKSYEQITREEIAKASEISPSVISFHFRSMEHLRNEILRKAVAEENLKIIAQGLVNHHPVALRAPLKNKRAAAKLIGQC